MWLGEQFCCGPRLRNVEKQAVVMLNYCKQAPSEKFMLSILSFTWMLNTCVCS